MSIAVNDVLDGVMDALASQYPGVTLVAGDAGEEHPRPLFAVRLVSVKHNREMGRRYRFSHEFNIQYAAAVPTYRGLHDVADQLYSTLQHITADGGLIRGSGMRHEIIDGILHFFIQFNFHVLSVVTPETKMQAAEREVRPK
ncbi:hypothetical protein PAECIP111893_03510 [Paenibacillus plantiphilus]|uniref:Uncharacterized protein n=1 Tax=Paenibacillus plantiphilus TaxID=2905650 RepID=A0ABM9CGK4_9BACL|nr:hypothetical protein [Paenibacillus plantiphilus]CAH1212255.1 hypothetical protein PAECIP111893_03510 [Paenibacillus plantiphilus]